MKKLYDLSIYSLNDVVNAEGALYAMKDVVCERWCIVYSSLKEKRCFWLLRGGIWRKKDNILTDQGRFLEKLV